LFVFSAFLPGFSLLYAIRNNPFTEIRNISLTYFNGKETTLVSWRQVGDFAGLDYNYQQDRLYWADSFSIYRSFLNGTGEIQSLTGVEMNMYVHEEFNPVELRDYSARFTKKRTKVKIIK